MGEKSKKEGTKKSTFSHREGAEWLTGDICLEYFKRAQALGGDAGDTGERRKLRIELQNRCDLTELQAMNILAGYCVQEYLQLYAEKSGKVQGNYGQTQRDYERLIKIAEYEEKIKMDAILDEDMD